MIARRPGERGNATMEFVLVLPFLWLIFALSMAVGAALVVKHRTVVAVRETAIKVAFSGTEFRSAVAAVKASTLTPRGISGDCRIIEERPTVGFDSVPVVGTFLSTLSGTRRYVCEGRPTRYMRIFGARQTGTGFTLDSGTWTYEELPYGYLSVLTNVMKQAVGAIGSAIGKLIGSLFR